MYLHTVVLKLGAFQVVSFTCHWSRTGSTFHTLFMQTVGWVRSSMLFIPLFETVAPGGQDICMAGIS